MGRGGGSGCHEPSPHLQSDALRVGDRGSDPCPHPSSPSCGEFILPPRGPVRGQECPCDRSAPRPNPRRPPGRRVEWWDRRINAGHMAAAPRTGGGGMLGLHSFRRQDAARGYTSPPPPPRSVTFP